MNRYIAEGVLADMLDGKTVLFLTVNTTAVRAAMDFVGQYAVAGMKVRRANGHESIHVDGCGSVRFRSIRSDLWGTVADVVVFDVDPVDHYELVDQIWHDFRRQAARPVEFIRP